VHLNRQQEAYSSVRETSIDGPRCILGIRYFLKKALARLKIETREAFSGEVIDIDVV